jgi:hypothetical protein
MEIRRVARNDRRRWLNTPKGDYVLEEYTFVPTGADAGTSQLAAFLSKPTAPRA